MVRLFIFFLSTPFPLTHARIHRQVVYGSNPFSLSPRRDAHTTMQMGDGDGQQTARANGGTPAAAALATTR
uniref:Putative secreted protein n=1 Tax=Anopheles darlingi TaxID=43151 RepID=A0A2M4D7D9_ANODA